jgi:hypothetical protein
MLFPYLWLRSTGFPFRWLDELALPGLYDPDSPDFDDTQAFDRHMRSARRRLVDLLGEPGPLEALQLSNPAAVDRMADLAAADLARPNARTRERLRLAWSYLQRFCAKNETCSFFGPLAWGRVEPGPRPSLTIEPALTIEPGGPQYDWLRRRRVTVEHWVVDRICAAITAEHEADLPLRLNPACDLDGDLLRIPLGRQVTLPPGAALLVRSVVDGKAPTGAAEPGPFERRLVKAGVLSRGIAVPPETRQPLRELADAAVHELGAAGARDSPTVRAVELLEDLRHQFEAADLGRRRILLAEMLRVLGAAGIDTRREAGRQYAGRSPVYEDCERNISFLIGGALAEVLETDLPPVLRLYRLIAECAASRLHDHYEQILRTQSAPDGRSPSDDFLVLLAGTRSADADQARDALIHELRTELAQAWAEIEIADPAAGTELGDADLELITARLRSRYPLHARHADTLGVGVVSPDVMIAAPGAAISGRAVLDGEMPGGAIPDAGTLRIVLGEVHPCVPTAVQSVALPFLDRCDDALRLADRLLAPGRVLLAATSQDYHRSQITWPVTPNLYEVVVPGATGRCAPERQIPVGRGRVQSRAGVLHFVDRATGRAEDIVTVLSSDLHRVMFALAGDVLGGSLAPRLAYRGIEIKRRTWRFAAADLPATGLPAATRPGEQFAHYAAFRDWARARQLPRRGFFRTDTEIKPLFVDWANPLSVDTFAKLTRTCTAVRISPMSPAPDELWFTDQSGLHTAELRMTYAV